MAVSWEKINLIKIDFSFEPFFEIMENDKLRDLKVLYENISCRPG